MRALPGWSMRIAFMAVVTLLRERSGGHRADGDREISVSRSTGPNPFEVWKQLFRDLRPLQLARSRWFPVGTGSLVAGGL
jgi:hypothetical protein